MVPPETEFAAVPRLPPSAGTVIESAPPVTVIVTGVIPVVLAEAVPAMPSVRTPIVINAEQAA